MREHRFVVNVPNPSARAVTANLRLEKVKHARLPRIVPDFRQRPSKVLSVALMTDPCASEGPAERRLKLAPRSSVDVHVRVVTAPQPGAKDGIAAFDLIDERGGSVAGGVTLVCLEQPAAEPAPGVVRSPRPCPVVIAEKPYAVPPGDDPGGRRVRTIPLGVEVELVVPITNPTKRRLQAVRAYLEHIGESDAVFVPVTWNVGTLHPGDVFFAAWPLTTSGSRTGGFEISVVVDSAGKDPTRLPAIFRIAAGD